MKLKIIEVILFNLLYYNAQMKQIKEDISSKIMCICKI